MSDTRPVTAAHSLLFARKTIADYLESGPPFPESDYARDALRNLDKALAYLHKCGGAA